MKVARGFASYKVVFHEEIKKLIKEAGLKQWQIAKRIGITAGTLTVWLRDDPLPEEHRQLILDAIKKGG